MDAAGAGGSRPFTYAVPEALADLEDGEAVLVEFGRRQALGVVLGPAREVPATTKPIVERVRADGPLLPPLTLALARWIAEHYLAPPALVIRAMLPPGLLERLELVAERTPAPAPSADDLETADADLLDQLGVGARPARELAAPDGRAGLLRRLRGLASRDLVTLDWTLLGAGAGPRYERWIRLLPEGRAAAVARRRSGIGRCRVVRWVPARSRPSPSWPAYRRTRTAWPRRTLRDGTAARPSRRSSAGAWPRPASGNDRAGHSPRGRPGRAAGGRDHPSCPSPRRSRSTASAERSSSAIRGPCSSMA